MKIATDTDDLLIVEDKPVLLGLALILFILVFVGIGVGVIIAGVWAGLVFVLVGGGLGALAFFAFVRRVQVVFHRPGNWVEVRRRNLLGGSKVRHRLDAITRAEIESSSTSGGATYRVVLVIDAGPGTGRHPVTLAFSSGESHHIIAAKINDWLGVSQTA